MIKIINCKNKNYLKKLIKFLDKRRSKNEIDTKIVIKILKDINKNKIKAVKKYEKKFSKNNKIIPSKNEIKNSLKLLDPKIKKAIDYAYNRILKFHSLQKFKDINYKDKYKNKLKYKYIPIQSAGIYVPANLPSTLLMNVIPAKLAGVKRIVLANPRLNGKLNPAVMYVAKKAGINEIRSVGGAQAVGMLTYVDKVNKIVGPGNIYVARAKKEVFGNVGIEGSIMGPSEIAVVADNKTNLNQVITSIIGQAEHDINSQCILITKDKILIDQFRNNLFKRLNNIERKKIIQKSLINNGLILYVKNDDQIIKVINEIAPEHLELNISNYKKYLKKITNTGSICVGKYSPMAVSDYNAGTNHILPTLGSAKFSSGLSLNDFYKKISYINLSKKGVEVIGKQAITLAEYENLYGHAQSIKSRIRSL